MGRKLLQGALVGAAAACLALGLWLVGALEIFEAKTWDLRVRLLARPAPAGTHVAQILVNQKDLNWAKEVNGWPWPWPRTAYAAVASFCKRGGARALVFDLVFTEHSAFGVDDDQTFGGGLADNGRVVGIFNLGTNADEGDATAWDPAVRSPGVSIAGLDDWLRRTRAPGMTFSHAQFPIPELSAGAAILANPKLFPDRVDGVYRREPLFGVFDGKVVPSEALAAWILGAGGEASLSIRPGTLTVGGAAVPIDGQGRAVLRYRPAGTMPSWSAAAVIQSEIQLMSGEKPALDPAIFKDAYVFFGVASAGLYDLKQTPLPGLTPAVQINSTMLDNLLTAGFMRTAPLAPTLLLLLLLCLGAGVAVSFAPGAGRSALVYVAFLPLAPALGVLAYALGWWLQMVALELGTLLALVGGSLASYATEGQQKRWIKNAFRQYLSPAVIEELIAHPERLALGGERRELTIFFSDVQGFTGISEALSPEALTTLLNEYLSAMTDIIQEEGGTIDKYEGDAIIAFWNAPLPVEDHAVRGVRAALRCQARLAELRPGFRGRINRDMFMRVGMNTGPAVVGNMGSRNRFDYTMLGDQVNLAARLEGINKQFGTYTMVSESVIRGMAGAFPARELSRVAVVGRKEPVTVYEPMLPEERSARAPLLDVFARGLAEYYSGRFAEALRAFSETAGADPAAAAYARRCQALLDRPPEGGWTGVWVMTEK
jgi:adenylate cyclase